MTTTLPLTLHLTREQRAELGEPVRHEVYTGELPANRADVCGATLTFAHSVHVCARWSAHDGDHADISVSGLVLETWPNGQPGQLPLSPQKKALYIKLNDIVEALEADISSAQFGLRRLQEEARGVADNVDLLEQIEYSLDKVESAENELWEAGADEADWR